MIRLYTGTPGSGKSLHVAAVIFNKVKNGGNVICNFEFNNDVFAKNRRAGMMVMLDNWEITPKYLMDFCAEHHKRRGNGHIIEGQTLLVLDECQLLFNARSWNARGRDEWCSFFTQHRKYGYDVILVTQFDRLVDRQIRSLVEYEIKHRKVNNYKWFGRLLGVLAGGSLFVAVEYWYGVKEKIGSSFFRYSRKYSRLYDSYKIFSVEQKEKKPVVLGMRNESEVQAVEAVV